MTSHSCGISSTSRKFPSLPFCQYTSPHALYHHRRMNNAAQFGSHGMTSANTLYQPQTNSTPSPPFHSPEFLNNVHCFDEVSKPACLPRAGTTNSTLYQYTRGSLAQVPNSRRYHTQNALALRCSDVHHFGASCLQIFVSTLSEEYLCLANLYTCYPQ